MAHVSLSKSSLAKQNRALQTYRRFLPALDLKRKQLMVERAKALAAQQQTRAAIDVLREQVRDQLPMLANHDIRLTDLITVSVRHVEIGQENVVGTRLPVFIGIDLAYQDYGFMSRPHWVDRLTAILAELLTLEAQWTIHHQRQILLDEAVRKVTQRVNLFDKVLIPQARDNIRRIKVYLADSERAAIVRSKIAKNKRLAQTEIPL